MSTCRQSSPVNIHLGGEKDWRGDVLIMSERELKPGDMVDVDCTSEDLGLLFAYLLEEGNINLEPLWSGGYATRQREVLYIVAPNFSV